MKNFKTLAKLGLVGFISTAMFTSCTDLIVEGTDSVIIEGTGGTSGGGGDAKALLENLYNGLGQWNDQGNIYSLNQHTSAEMIPPTRGVDWGDNGVWRTLHAHTWDATHQQVLNSWNSMNSRSFTTEQVLASNPTPQQAAEAKTLRALFMWYILDYWRQVPRRTVDQGVNDLPMVMKGEEAFNFIVKDLEEAIPNLPSAGPAAINAQASKALAYTLLARLYLNKAVYLSANPAGPYTFNNADMDKVVQYADLVAAEGYSLDPDFFNVFTKNSSSEKILTDLQGVPRNRWMMTMHYDQGGFPAEQSGPWNGFTTLADFYDTFENGDQRKFREVGFDPGFGGLHKGFLIGQQFREDKTPIVDSRSRKPLQFTRDVPLAGAATEKGIRAIKYHPSDHGKMVIFRYADVYLMKAEALLRSGKNADALKMVNDLRTLRGVAAFGSLTEDNFFAERSRELYWEGIARTDEVRFGKFARQYDFIQNVEPYTVLFPIPSQALASNTNLTQNEGY